MTFERPPNMCQTPKQQTMKKLFTLALFLGFFQSQAQNYIPVKNDDRIRVKPAIPLKAYGFDLKDVRLLDGSPLRNAMDRDAGYLLFLEPDRLLHRFHLNAGLPTKAPVYAGWETEGLSGHTLGHYLSAISLVYASTGNAEYKKRIDYIVSELARCQQARGTGFVGAMPGEDSAWHKVSVGDIRTGGFDLNGLWAPWYVVHKLMAGLLDAYLYTDNKEAVAIVEKMSDWTGNLLKNLNQEQLQRMLKCEYGGMNDVLAQLYAITGNKKHLDRSYLFFDDFVMQPLSEQIDPMPNKHSNTNVPKAIGSAVQYTFTGNERDKTIASFFWNTMVHNHSYVNGGNSNYEYCGEPGKLNDRLSDNTSETCNTYNMLKLTRNLFSWQPTAELGDYYERALYNHILASQHPETGMMCYFVPLRMGTKKQFSDSLNTFTCCVGSGMENHSKYGEAIYYNGADGSLYVNLFVPSTLNWREKKVRIRQETRFPEEDATTLVIETRKATSFPIRLRKPYWASTCELSVNGKVQPVTTDADGFLVVNRKWKNNDVIRLSLPMKLHTQAMPDNPNRIAVLYGPLLLAGRLGDQMPDPLFGTPVLLTDDKDVNNWIRPVSGQPLRFEMNGVGKPRDVQLIPFYQMYQEYYSVYWDYFTNADWAARQQEYEAEKKRLKEIADRTIDVFRIGEMQPERDHNLKASEKSYVSDAIGVNGREVRAGGFFSFEMAVDPAASNNLMLTYLGDDKNRQFDILVEGRRIFTETLTGGVTGKFFDREYPIPQELIGTKKTITIRIESNYGKTAGRIFGVRIVRRLAEPVPAQLLQADSVFLFSYFKGNGEDGLHLAASADGLQWHTLRNDSSFLTPTVARDKLMRDPCILKGPDGYFHMVWTVSWKDRGIGYARSKDLISWSEQQFLPVMQQEPAAQNCWAPEINYDPVKKQYIIYWSTTIPGRFPETEGGGDYNHRIYYTTTKDFITLSKTKLLYDKGFNVIDASIVANGKEYLMFLKDETLKPVAQKNIRIARSKSIDGNYSAPGHPITGKYWAEGPTAIKINGAWLLYFDKYTEHHYGLLRSTDLKQWEDITSQLKFPAGARHGSLFTITKEEFNRLIAN